MPGPDKYRPIGSFLIEVNSQGDAISKKRFEDNLYVGYMQEAIALGPSNELAVATSKGIRLIVNDEERLLEGSGLSNPVFVGANKIAVVRELGGGRDDSRYVEQYSLEDLSLDWSVPLAAKRSESLISIGGLIISLGGSSGNWLRPHVSTYRDGKVHQSFTLTESGIIMVESMMHQSLEKMYTL